MSVETLEITAPGIHTTVQDLGRFGYQRYGVPVSGAMDGFSLRAANLLVGNSDNAACLEITVTGLQIRFLSDTQVATTGADLDARLNGERMPRWQTVGVARGDELTFYEIQDGVRAYLAVTGGIDVPEIMGSRSTYVWANFGGFHGRALRAGDVLSALEFDSETEVIERYLPQGFATPAYGEGHEIRVVLGPQHTAFSPETIWSFTSLMFVVGAESDRMGYRLDGPVLESLSGSDIVSDGNPPGGIQVPGDGAPRVLMADKGTTGGYAKIATVISADIGRMAQALPGHSINFKSVTVEDAQQILRERDAVLAAIASGNLAALDPLRGLGVWVDGDGYEVVDQEGEVLSQPVSNGRNSSNSSQRVRATVGDEMFEFDVEVHDGA